MLRSSHVITPVSHIRQAHLLSTFVRRNSFVEVRPSKFVRRSLSDFARLSSFVESSWSKFVRQLTSKFVRPKFVRRSSFVGALSSELVRRNSFVEVRPPKLVRRNSFVEVCSSKFVCRSRSSQFVGRSSSVEAGSSKFVCRSLFVEVRSLELFAWNSCKTAVRMLDAAICRKTAVRMMV